MTERDAYDGDMSDQVSPSIIISRHQSNRASFISISLVLDTAFGIWKTLVGSRIICFRAHSAVFQINY